MATSRQKPTERTGRSAPGFTLLELIIVMMILSTLFGVGVGAFRSLTNPDQQARQQIGDALHSARLFARSEGAAAQVLVSPEQQTVSVWGLRRIGDWHFETADGFGWPKALLHEGSTIEAKSGPDGLSGLGACLRLVDNELLTLQDPPPSFDSAHGFGLDVLVAPSPGYRPLTIWERPGVWAVQLNQDDELQVQLWLADGADKTSELRVTVPEVHLPGGRFTRLQVTFDGRALEVAVDGVRHPQDLLFEEAATLARNPRVSQGTGRPPTHFRGLFDELHLSAVVRARVEELPAEVTLEGERQLIHLDAHGRLDPLWHNGPVEIAFSSGEPLRLTVIELGLLGALSRSSAVVPVVPTGDGTSAEDEGGDS